MEIIVIAHVCTYTGGKGPESDSAQSSLNVGNILSSMISCGLKDEQKDAFQIWREVRTHVHVHTHTHTHTATHTHTHTNTHTHTCTLTHTQTYTHIHIHIHIHIHTRTHTHIHIHTCFKFSQSNEVSYSRNATHHLYFLFVRYLAGRRWR